MEKERLVDIIKTGSFTLEDLQELDDLVRAYPWFGLPRFLKLKALEQLEKSPEPGELNKAVIFSSDRKHLYKWVQGAFDSTIETSGFGTTELEFLTDEKEDDPEAETEAEDPFVLLDDDDEEVGDEDDADAKPIPEKDESEMEEPEIDEPEAVPVIDPLDDDEGDKTVFSDETGIDDNGEQGDVKADPVTEAEMTGPENTGGGTRNLIEQFLKNEPGAIKADKKTQIQGDVSEGSVKEDDSFITDTLAKIYVKQGLHAKAIYAYERLSLKYPEKSAYFAAQIEKIKNITNV